MQRLYMIYTAYLIHGIGILSRASAARTTRVLKHSTVLKFLQSAVNLTFSRVQQIKRSAIVQDVT